ncbi:MAG TPA: hypothetical protein VIH90_06040, partial [Candidatus Saccharimonadales bacterium]
MKKLKKYLPFMLCSAGFCLLALLSINVMAQDVATDSTQLATDSLQPAPVVKKKAVKNTFESNWIQDNQSVMVDIKG